MQKITHFRDIEDELGTLFATVIENNAVVCMISGNKNAIALIGHQIGKIVSVPEDNIVITIDPKMRWNLESDGITIVAIGGRSNYCTAVAVVDEKPEASKTELSISIDNSHASISSAKRLTKFLTQVTDIWWLSLNVQQ